MSAALRSAWQSVVKTKRLYLNPHEDFGNFSFWGDYCNWFSGRANIFRCAAATYVTAFLLFKWNSNRKAKAIKAEKATQKSAVAQDALGRAGLA